MFAICILSVNSEADIPVMSLRLDGRKSAFFKVVTPVGI
jgi:hypothetical protein